LWRLFELLTDRPAFEEVRRVLIDSTIVRAHQHAAGARKKKAGRRRKVWAAVGAVSPAKSW
jgi:putative transposase